MHDFRFPKKLVRLTTLCMQNKQCKARVDKTVYNPFTVDTGLMQGDALSPILLNVALEKVVREMQCGKSNQLANNENILQTLGFADDFRYHGELTKKHRKCVKRSGKSCRKSRINNKPKQDTNNGIDR